MIAEKIAGCPRASENHGAGNGVWSHMTQLPASSLSSSTEQFLNKSHMTLSLVEGYSTCSSHGGEAAQLQSGPRFPYWEEARRWEMR